MPDLLFRLLASLPLSWLHGLGALLGRIVLRCSPGYRRHLLRNLKQAGYDDARLARRAATEAGKSALELPYVWLRSQQQVLGKISTSNWALVEEARAAARRNGKGLIFLTPHLGCFELTAQYLAAMPQPEGAPITVLYRPPRKTWLGAVMEQGRARHNLHTAPADLRGVRQMLRALKQGQAIGMLPDQVPNNGDGVWAPFFGQPAYTMTLPAKLHELTGAKLLLTWGERLPHGCGWVMHFDAFDNAFDSALSGTPEQQAARINAAMEALIRRCPEQYFWGYDRYKKPKNEPKNQARGDAAARPVTEETH